MAIDIALGAPPQGAGKRKARPVRAQRTRGVSRDLAERSALAVLGSTVAAFAVFWACTAQPPHTLEGPAPDAPAGLASGAGGGASHAR